MVAYTPVGDEHVDEEQSAVSALVRIGSRSREPGGVGIGHLDSDAAQTLIVEQGREEAPSGDAAVEDGVRGEFRTHFMCRAIGKSVGQF